MSDKFTASRKIVFVDKKFQFRFILNYCFLVLIGTALFSLSAYYILNHQLGESFFSAHLAIKKTGELLLPSLLYLSATFVLIFIVATIMITLLISHRISGPLFAIVRYLKMVSEGRFNFEAKLRTKDQTAVLADTLSETIKIIGGRVTVLKETTASLKKDISEIKSSMRQKGAGQDETIRAINDLEDHLKIIEERLAFFQTV